MSQNNYTIKGNDIAYSIPEGATVPWGVLLSCSHKPSQNLSEFDDRAGEVGTLVLNKRKSVYSLEVLCAARKGQKVSDLPVPVMGDVVQYKGKYCLVTSVEEKEDLNDAKKYSVELTWYPNIDLAPDAGNNDEPAE